MAIADTPQGKLPSSSEDIRESEESPGHAKTPQQEAVERVAAGGKVTPKDQADALEWMLADDIDEASIETKAVEINIGTQKNPKWITWVLRAADTETMKAVRAAQAQRTRRRGVISAEPTPDEIDEAARIVSLVTVEPDLKKVVATKGVADPALVVKHRFRNKPGLLISLSAVALELAGWSDDDIREPIEAKVAGNS